MQGWVEAMIGSQIHLKTVLIDQFDVDQSLEVNP